MLILAVETAGPQGGLALVEARLEALGDPPQTLALRPLPRQKTASGSRRRGHGIELGPGLENLLQEAGVEAAAVQLVAVDIGPGSYTGLRIGVAAAKGFSLALGCSLLGLVSLDALAVETIATESLTETDSLAVVIRASAREAYLGRYCLSPEGRPQRLAEPAIVAYADLQEILGDSSPRLSGDGAADLAAALGNPGLATSVLGASPNVLTIGAEAARLHAEGVRHSTRDITPLYLRLSEAEEQKRKHTPPKS